MYCVLPSRRQSTTTSLLTIHWLKCPYRAAYGTWRNETKRNEMVFCETVFCETVFCETVFCEMVFCGMVFCETVFCEMVLCGTAFCETVFCETVRCEMVFCEMVRCETSFTLFHFMFHLLAVKKAKEAEVFNDKVKHTSQTIEITFTNNWSLDKI